MAKVEDHPPLLVWAQRWPARLLLLAAFAALFYPLYTPYLLPGRPDPRQIIGAAVLCSLAGRYRSQMLALTTLIGLLLAPEWYPAGWVRSLAEQQGLPATLLLPLQLLMTPTELYHALFPPEWLSEALPTPRQTRQKGAIPRVLVHQKRTRFWKKSEIRMTRSAERNYIC